MNNSILSQSQREYLDMAGQVAAQIWPGNDQFAQVFRSVVLTESSADPHAISIKGAIGLAQIMPSTGASIDPSANLYDPEDNLRVGATYLKELIEQNGGDYSAAIQNYYAGPGNENSTYLEQVMGNFATANDGADPPSAENTSNSWIPEWLSGIMPDSVSSNMPYGSNTPGASGGGSGMWPFNILQEWLQSISCPLILILIIAGVGYYSIRGLIAK